MPELACHYEGCPELLWAIQTERYSCLCRLPELSAKCKEVIEFV